MHNHTGPWLHQLRALAHFPSHSFIACYFGRFWAFESNDVACLGGANPGHLGILRRGVHQCLANMSNGSVGWKISFGGVSVGVFVNLLISLIQYSVSIPKQTVLAIAAAYTLVSN